MNPTPLVRPVKKPEHFNNYRDRLDFIHQNLQPTLGRYVVRADEMFRTNAILTTRQPESRYRLFNEIEFRASQQDWSYRLQPTFDADIELPSLEDRWRIYLHSRARDSLGERDPEEGARATRLGLYGVQKNLHISTDTGVRLRTLPEAFARIQWGRNWNRSLWVIRPGQRFYYETSKGFGSLTSLTFHRWIGDNPNVFFQAISSVERGEDTEGTELQQAFRLGKVKEALETMDRWERVLGDRDIAKGYVFRASVDGHSENESVMDGYRIGVVVRHPLYKKWIYLHLNPELRWENESDWETELRVRVAVDMLFWGAQER